MKPKTLCLRAFIGYLLCYMSLAGNLHSQGLTATLTGRILDQSGGSIAGTRIVATHADTGYTKEVTTSESGSYSLTALPVGVYSIEASMKGFKTLKKTPVTLNANQQLALDFTLSPGSVEQSIEVNSDVQYIQTQDATVNAKVYIDQAQNLPLNSRSPFELALLSPSISVSKQQSGPAMQFNINGSNANGYKLSFDGMEAGIGGDAQYWAGNNFNLSITSLDAIQEYDIATSNYSADIKGSSGYVNIVSKTGTNQIHGSFYDFYRNGALDARNFFEAKAGSLKLNDFGGTIGGPIKKDKIFYMVSYEGQRIHVPFAGFSRVPTAAFRAIVDPRMQPFLNLTPLPTEAIPGDPVIGIWRGNPLSIASQNLVTGRMDFIFGQKDRLFVQYTFNDGDLSGATLDPRVSQQNVQTIYPGYATLQPERHQSATLGWTRTFSPTFVNDLRVGVNRFLQGRVRGPTDPAYFDVPVISVPGLVIGGGGNKKKLGNTQPQLSDKATWVKGRSTFSFGGNYAFLMSGQNSFSVMSMAFVNAAGFAADKPSSVSSTYGTSLTQLGEHLSYNQVGLFVQEDFRWKPNLTVNIGLRYDNFGVFSDSTCNAKNVISTPFDPFRPPCDQLYDGNNDFGPRFGFAWTPLSGKPFVLRGGFGIFYGTHVSGQMGDVLGINNSLPFSATATDFPNLSYPFSPGLFANVTAKPGRFVLNPTTPDLYSEQWNLTAEYQFTNSMIFSLAYVGNHGLHVPVTQRPNTYYPIVGSRPSTSFGDIRMVANEGYMFYNGLQATLRRRLSNNLAFDVNYAWSHATGFTSGNLDISAAVSFSDDQVQTVLNTNLSRGTLPTDVTHNFSGDFIYQLPKLANSSKWVRAFLGDWTTSGLMKISSGLPFNLTTGLDAGDQRFTQRPNIVPGVSFTKSGVSPADGILNRAAFTVPTYVYPTYGLKLGDMANNSVRMPVTFYADWMVQKRVFTTEKIWLDFRTEFFNVFNHPVFALPVTSMASSSFGKSSSADPGRQIQFMLKFSF